MSADLSKQDIEAAECAVEQVIDECKAEGQRSLQAWIDTGQDTSIALRDIADDIVRRLIETYDLGWLQ